MKGRPRRGGCEGEGVEGRRAGRVWRGGCEGEAKEGRL